MKITTNITNKFSRAYVESTVENVMQEIKDLREAWVEISALRDEKIPEMAGAMKENEWELAIEDGGVQIYQGDQYVTGITFMAPYAIACPVRVTDGTNTVDIWVVDQDSVAMFDTMSQIIVVSESILTESTPRQIMAMCLHEVYHQKKWKTSPNVLQFLYRGKIKMWRPFIYLSKIEELLADHNARKHGYGDDLAEWLVEWTDEDWEYDNVYTHFLKSHDSHPHTLIRTRLLKG